jgi:tetratricopeptide (TPR) repeat protein
MSFSSSDSHLEITPPSALELLWFNHRNTALLSMAAVIVLGLIVLGVVASKHSSLLASETLLSNATDDEGLREVIAKYPNAPAAADAMLLLASSLRDEGKIMESDDLYSRFSEAFPTSTLGVSGLLGRAANARVSKNFDAALNNYQQAGAAYPQSYGAPFALYSQIQLLLQSGKPEDAKKILQTLVSQYPGSVAAQAFGGGQPASNPSGSAASE